MADNNKPDSILSTPDPAKRQWVALGVSVSPEFKARLEKVARETGLAPSAFSRMVLMREVAQLERGESAA